MSAATKKKHVEREVREESVLPLGDQFIARVISGRGNNLHEVENPKGEKFLVSMPTKFRKTVWIKRGDFAICQPIEEGDKVRAEIVHILYKDNIRYIQKQKLWPESFPITREHKENSDQYHIDTDLLPPSDSEEESELEGDSD